MGIEFLEPAPPLFEIALLTAVASQHYARVDVDAVDVASLQPLADEILDECFGAVVFEHSLDLYGEFLRNS